MTKIIKFRYPGLWHSEYPLVVNRLIDVIGRHDPEALHLQRSYQQLAAFRPLLSKIEVQERADRNSALLSELDQQRDTLYNVIFAVSKALKRTPRERPYALSRFCAYKLPSLCSSAYKTSCT